MRNSNVAIKLSKPNDKTKGGIILPPTAEEGILRYGTVVAAGPGEFFQGTFVELDLKKDDEVVFDSSRSAPITVDGVLLYVCNSLDVLAVVHAKHLSVVEGS